MALYQWVPLYPKYDGVSNNPVLPAAARAARLATFCRAYGAFSPAEALDALIEELPFHADVIQELGQSGDPRVARLLGWNVPARVRMETELLRGQEGVFLGSTR